MAAIDETRARLVWIGLVIASSPALTSLATGLRDEAPRRYTLLALLLLLLLVLREPLPASRPRPGLGWALLAIGLGAQLLGAASASGSIAHLGLATSVLGTGAMIGRPSWRALVLVLGLVPVPTFVLALASPTLESQLAALAGRFLAALGVSVDVGGPLLQTASGRFELWPADSGIVTAICAAEVAWFRAMRQGVESSRALYRAVRASGLGLLAQPLLVCVTATSLPLGYPEIGRFLLSHSIALGLSIAVLWSEARRR